MEDEVSKAIVLLQNCYHLRMDPITQGLIGATASLTAANLKHKREHVKIAAFLGLLGGMAPDLDVFIRSQDDPLLFLEFHRHFTHSLFFIPIAGVLFTLLLYAIVRKQCNYRQTFFYVTLGYASHGLLDACTTYGTQLLWPFSDTRVAWNIISVIDPIFTVSLLLLVVIIIFSSRLRITYLACVWVVMYLCAGVLQHQRAVDSAWQLADQRGHTPKLIKAKPSFGNILVWKTIYQEGEYFYVDAIRAGVDIQFIPGESIRQLDVASDFPWLDQQSQQAVDIERFRWFSNGYLAVDPRRAHHIIDIRYSMLPHQATGLWGIALTPQADHHQHVSYETFRSNDMETRQLFWHMITGAYESAQ